MTKEHWTQVLAIVVPIVLALGSAMLGEALYFTAQISTIISNQNFETTARSSLQTQVSTLVTSLSRIEVEDQKISALSQRLDQQQQQFVTFQRDTSEGIRRIQDIVGDIRVQVGAGTKEHK